MRSVINMHYVKQCIICLETDTVIENLGWGFAVSCSEQG